MIAVRVLIVEDETSLAHSLCRALTLSGTGKYDAETCSSGEDALVRLPRHDYAVLVTDLHLGGMDGLALLAQASRISPHTRSILITGYGSQEVEVTARAVADRYLTKPFGLQEFVEAVNSVASTATSSATDGSS